MRPIPIAVSLALALSVACGPAQPAPLTGTFTTPTGGTAGSVAWRAVDGGLELRFRAEGLAPGPHGVHLHAVAACEGPAFASAGGHFNPAGRRHGHANPEGPHAGDLGNVTAGPDGRVEHRVTVAGLELPATGLALVIHAAADDERTDPAGNAGARVLCAVLRPRA